VSYLVDADVLIQAKNAHYRFDVVPGFWDWLDEAHVAGRVYSVTAVRQELIGGGDELADWVKDRESFFLAPDNLVTDSMAEVSTWATTQQPPYEGAAVAEFLAAADYYLVSHARAHGLTVVTAEVAADTVKKVKIPNACRGLGVPCTNVFAMLQAEGARFVNGR
jgi:predicted nucleic acid-binding protein